MSKRAVAALAASLSAVFTGSAFKASDAVGSSTGAVFLATNGAAGNEITMFHRASDGSLRRVGTFPTGGRGEGGVNDPLQSSDALLLTPDHAFLLAVNAGSSDISVFRVLPDGLALASVTPSRGGNPVSLAIHDNLVFVVNTGGDVHTAGFALEASGRLVPLPNTKQPLSTLDTGASTAVFSPDGSKLIVTERLTNLVDVFSVGADGSLSDPVFNKSAGVEPFGATVTPAGALLVTEAGSGSMSSYTINADNTLTTLTGAATAHGGATCWVGTNGRYAWVSNTTSSDIDAFSLLPGGTLGASTIAATVPATGPTLFPPVKPATSFPLDIALSGDQRFLFVTFSAVGDVLGYAISDDGSLTRWPGSPPSSRRPVSKVWPPTEPSRPGRNARRSGRHRTLPSLAGASPLGSSHAWSDCVRGVARSRQSASRQASRAFLSVAWCPAEPPPWRSISTIDAIC